MDIKAMAQQVRLTHWAGVLHARNESGQSVRSWCRENQITEKTYYYWQRKLRETACEQITELQAATSRKRLSVPGFAEVKLGTTIVPPTIPPALLGTVPPSQIQIEISGIRINTDDKYPTDKLVALCRELARPC